jgi:hypothetical protein
LQKDRFRGVWWTEMTFRYFYHVGNVLYDFQNLAFSKARYGGGLEGDTYHSPAVRMSHVYMASRAHWFPGVVSLDLYVFLMLTGFVGNVTGMYRKLLFGSRKCDAPVVNDGSALSSAASASTQLSGALSTQLSGALSSAPSGALSRQASGALAKQASGGLAKQPSGRLSTQGSGAPREPAKSARRGPRAKIVAAGAGDAPVKGGAKGGAAAPTVVELVAS